MPRFLAIGHVTWDRLAGGEVPGGSATYAALAAQKLGWEAAVLTAAAADFDPARDLPGVQAFVSPSATTTRFRNDYDEDGTRRQVLVSRASEVDLLALPDDWRSPEVLFLAPVAGEVHGRTALAFTAEVVGAGLQGWLRAVDTRGNVTAREVDDPGAELAGVHVLFLSEEDLPEPGAGAAGLLRHVPVVALTKGWRGVQLFTRQGSREIPGLPRPEVDPTGAGDVFAAAFLLRYQETGDPEEAAVFAACAASCVVEGVGAGTLGDRAEVQRRHEARERLIEDGEWDE